MIRTNTVALPRPLPRFDPLADREPVDPAGRFLGMGRSTTFPLPEWRANDPYRTVYFDEGQGRTLVFLHGLGGNATHWEFVVRSLASARRHRLVGFDFVGCGWSAKPDVAYTIPLLRDHVLAMMDRLGIERATLVGHSLGGAVAMATAIEAPARVDGLAMVCAPCCAPLPRWMRAAAPLFLRRRLLYHCFVEGHNQIVGGVFVDSPEQNPGVRWFCETSMRDEPGYSNVWQFARIAETLCRDVVRTDFSQRLGELQMPVLGIWGEADRLTAVPSVLRAMGRIRRVRTVTIPRSGHMPMIERPEDVTFQLKRFLDSPP